MWSRAQLKDKAKYTFKLNYWKIVLVSLLIIALGAGVSNGVNYEFNQNNNDSGFSQDFEVFDSDYNDDYNYNFNFKYDLEEDVFDDYLKFDDDFEGTFIRFFTIFFVVFFFIMLVVLAVQLVWSAFIANPVEVGSKRFFFKSLNEKAEVKEAMFAFDHSYKNVAKIMFFRTLYTMLWSLLFVIPGIVKGYEYRMIPYLLAENPNLTKEQAFALSKQMMMGQKWDTFVLDLSFILWDLLSACTLGILSIFYVTPYKNMTNAALYEELSKAYGNPAMNIANPNTYQNMGYNNEG